MCAGVEPDAFCCNAAAGGASRATRTSTRSGARRLAQLLAGWPNSNH